ncbi:lysoplasmalogenase [Flavobacterium sp.]|uniref:lysoplasmalogenase n=1 Tax=Flavobacterium sp. TaxID=239 RepID=UPI0039E292B0
MKTAALLKSFIAIGMIYLLILLLGYDDTAWFLKPLLLPFLLAAVGASAKFKTKTLLFAALLFSWFGDIVLMFADQGERFFIIGLVLFLTAHVIYIALFNKQPKNSNPKSKLALAIGCLSVIGYLCAMLYLLFPTLGTLKIPVTIYAMVISTMLLMAIKGFGHWNNPGNYYIFIGAIGFVVSDSLLAFDKFHEPLPMASFNIMATYLAAQFLITFGILVLNKKQHSVLSDNAAI